MTATGKSMTMPRTRNYGTSTTMGTFFGDVDVIPVRSCTAPTELPGGCAQLEQNVPPQYGDGIPGETTPSCPVAPCDASMWKQNLPNTDCMDRPDQVGTGVPRGNNPTNVNPGASDHCNDRDHDCDGTANTGCSCSPIGATLPCGSAATCNEGMQQCTSAGWSACCGGVEKPKVTYCPDDDQDTFCVLASCVPGLCPGSPPQDGHKYVLRTSCTGEDFGETDCNDSPYAANPGNVSEVCNGDGVDCDCNGNTNSVGAGDRACVNGTNRACAPVGLTYPDGVVPGDPLTAFASGVRSPVLPGPGRRVPADREWSTRRATNHATGTGQTTNATEYRTYPAKATVDARVRRPAVVALADRGHRPAPQASGALAWETPPRWNTARTRTRTHGAEANPASTTVRGLSSRAGAHARRASAASNAMGTPIGIQAVRRREATGSTRTAPPRRTTTATDSARATRATREAASARAMTGVRSGVPASARPAVTPTVCGRNSARSRRRPMGPRTGTATIR